MAAPDDTNTPAGSPPAPDAPPPEVQDVISVDVSFPPAPDAASICGFAIPPHFSFALNINIPFPNFKLPLPFNFSLALKCDLSDPLDAEVSFGGGRKATGEQGAKAEDIDY